MPDHIITSLEGNGIYTILLNHPAKHNCIGAEMLQMLDAAVERAYVDNAVRVVLIRGAGAKSFCTGANLKEFNALEGKEVEEWILTGNRIFDRLESLPKPTVAYVHGFAMGGGLELALSCDFRLATTEALLSFPEVHNGWLPGWGGIPRLCRLVGEANAKRIILLSEQIPSAESLQLGLISQLLTDPSKHEEELRLILEKLLTINTDAYKLAKSAIRQSMGNQQGDPYFDVLAAYFAKKQ